MGTRPVGGRPPPPAAVAAAATPTSPAPLAAAVPRTAPPAAAAPAAEKRAVAPAAEKRSATAAGSCVTGLRTRSSIEPGLEARPPRGAAEAAAPAGPPAGPPAPPLAPHLNVKSEPVVAVGEAGAPPPNGGGRAKVREKACSIVAWSPALPLVSPLRSLYQRSLPMRRIDPRVRALRTSLFPRRPATPFGPPPHSSCRNRASLAALQ